MTKINHDEFLKTVKDHQMTVLNDNEPYIHLLFKGDSLNNWFEVSSAGNLITVNGDRGTYVFAVRSGHPFGLFNTGSSSQIRPAYWQEKLVASSSTPNVFSPTALRAAVSDALEGVGMDDSIEAQVRKDADRMLEDLLDRIAWELDENGQDFIGVQRLILDTVDRFTSHGVRIHDFYEYNFTEHTREYLWNCYAAAYAMQSYLKSKKS